MELIHAKPHIIKMQAERGLELYIENRDIEI
jgi:hypothetical protein